MIRPWNIGVCGGSDPRSAPSPAVAWTPPCPPRVDQVSIGRVGVFSSKGRPSCSLWRCTSSQNHAEIMPKSMVIPWTMVFFGGQSPGLAPPQPSLGPPLPAPRRSSLHWTRGCVFIQRSSLLLPLEMYVVPKSCRNHAQIHGLPLDNGVFRGSEPRSGPSPAVPLTPPARPA